MLYKEGKALGPHSQLTFHNIGGPKWGLSLYFAIHTQTNVFGHAPSGTKVLPYPGVSRTSPRDPQEVHELKKRACDEKALCVGRNGPIHAVDPPQCNPTTSHFIMYTESPQPGNPTCLHSADGQGNSGKNI